MKQLFVITFFLLFSSAVMAVASNYTIFVVSLGKHSGIIIPKKYADISYLSNKKKYINTRYIEYGYGDKDYYMSKSDPSIYVGAKAVFWPTNSVVKILTPDIEKYKKETDTKLYKLKLNNKQLELLKKYIKDTFLLKEDKAYPIGECLYDKGIFYEGTRDFYLFNTCNSWVIKALKNSDIDVSDWFVVTRGNLESEMENLTVENEESTQSAQEKFDIKSP
jgi:hypothetical protein